MDLTPVVLCCVWSGAELILWSVLVGALQSDVSPVATYCALCIRGDLREAVCSVVISAELYAFFDDHVLVLRAHHSYFNTGHPLLQVCQDGSHGCWRQ